NFGVPMDLYRLSSMGCGALLLAFTAQMSTAADSCNRACLRETLDAYVSALVAHKPIEAPFASTVRSTQNGAVTPIGEGLWRTAGLPERRRNAFDPQTGNAVTQLLLQVDGTPALAFIRIKVANRHITEAETIIAEKGKLHPGVLSDFDAFAKDTQPEWAEAIPASQRASRSQLLAVAETY